MAEMKRILISFGVPALKWLKFEAKRLGISINEIVRRCVDLERDKPTKTPKRRNR